MTSPERRLKDLGIVLPRPPKPVANYVGWVRTGNLVYVAGQLSLSDGKIQFPGLLGGNVSLEDGQRAARLSAINITAQLSDATDGDLSKVTRVVKLNGFVASVPEFADHAKIMNAASDFLAEVFGERGKHARLTVGVPCLPLNSPIEIDAVVELE